MGRGQQLLIDALSFNLLTLTFLELSTTPHCTVRFKVKGKLFIKHEAMTHYGGVEENLHRHLAWM
jgi:hypothetical protein